MISPMKVSRSFPSRLIFRCTNKLDMFRALEKFDLPRDHVYSVTVGASSKQTDANWHLLEPADVIGSIQMLINANQDH
jgi:trehalose 6-phosphate synthase/phosphatase